MQNNSVVEDHFLVKCYKMFFSTFPTFRPSEHTVRGGRGWIISYKSLYFVTLIHEFIPEGVKSLNEF